MRSWSRMFRRELGSTSFSQSVGSIHPLLLGGFAADRKDEDTSPILADEDAPFSWRLKVRFSGESITP